MKSFKHIANLIRLKRIIHPSNLSQAELSSLLGYKNGQFISNVERGCSSVPLKMIRRISEVLKISQEEIKEAYLKDYEDRITFFYNKPLGSFSYNYPESELETGEDELTSSK